MRSEVDVEVRDSAAKHVQVHEIGLRRLPEASRNASEDGS